MKAELLGAIPQGALIVGQSTWANRPAASAYNGKGWYMTNLKHVFISDGTDWFPLGGSARGGGSNVAATVTGTTNRTSVWSETIPADLLGLNGQIWIYPQITVTNNANAKNPRIKLGSTDFWQPTGVSITSTSGLYIIANRNNKAVQVGTPGTSAAITGTSGAASAVAGTENTANALTLDFSFQLANASDSATLERIYWELRK